ncbi:myb-related protein 305-like [Impatiens glandulifera]|uniref:myb-related protein 305-like n=1 Tax=Impatiens glandulifera TaxID=253017 RepID=UPI001FB05C62|nr:myb-related protein 305-like [Impatiens glandulifera]
MKVQYCQKTGLRKGKWSHEEDQQLIAYIKRFRIWNWNEIAKAADLLRSGKSCRLRWMNYLKPDLKHGNFTKEEDEIIVEMYKTMGSKWSRIASKLSGRSDNEIKNHWHTNLRKHGDRHSKMRSDRRNKEKTTMSYDEDQQASRSEFSITMANNEPYNIFETNFTSFEQFVIEQQPLSVEDYDIEGSWNIVIADHTLSSSQLMYSSSTSSSSISNNQYEEEICTSTTIQEQDENSYGDTMLMISGEEFPQIEGTLHEFFNDWEFLHAILTT